jgi:hypothetical protein
VVVVLVAVRLVLLLLVLKEQLDQIQYLVQLHLLVVAKVVEVDLHQVVMVEMVDQVEVQELIIVQQDLEILLQQLQLKELTATPVLKMQVVLEVEQQLRVEHHQIVMVEMVEQGQQLLFQDHQLQEQVVEQEVDLVLVVEVVVEQVVAEMEEMVHQQVVELRALSTQVVAVEEPKVIQIQTQLQVDLVVQE